MTHEPHPEHDPPESRGIVLDIGGDVGALIVHAPRSLLGAEVEVSPAAAPTHRVHAIVREQSAPAGTTVIAAVFPDLFEGQHLVWGEAGSTVPIDHVRIIGGQVAEATIDGPTGPVGG